MPWRDRQIGDMEQRFDAIVVGAGPAGCACGYKLAQNGLQVLVVERGRFAGAKNMWGGAFFGFLFFILLSFAAWTSAISLIEPIVAWLVENRGLSRIKATVWAGGITWALGLGSLLSLNLWQDFKIIKWGILDFVDKLTTNVMLPLGGLAIAIFAAWIMSRESTEDELAIENPLFYQLWRFFVRYITPVAVVVVFLNAIGVIQVGKG